MELSEIVSTIIGAAGFLFGGWQFFLNRKYSQKDKRFDIKYELYSRFIKEVSKFKNNWNSLLPRFAKKSLELGEGEFKVGKGMLIDFVAEIIEINNSILELLSDVKLVLNEKSYSIIKEAQFIISENIVSLNNCVDDLNFKSSIITLKDAVYQVADRIDLISDKTDIVIIKLDSIIENMREEIRIS